MEGIISGADLLLQFLKKREAKINVLTILLGQHTLHTLYRNAGYYIQESEVVAWIWLCNNTFAGVFTEENARRPFDE